MTFNPPILFANFVSVVPFGLLAATFPSLSSNVYLYYSPPSPLSRHLACLMQPVLVVYNSLMMMMIVRTRRIQARGQTRKSRSHHPWNITGMCAEICLN